MGILQYFQLVYILNTTARMTHELFRGDQHSAGHYGARPQRRGTLF